MPETTLAAKIQLVSPRLANVLYKYALFIIVFSLFSVVFWYVTPPALDWDGVFLVVARSPLHPYIPEPFINPPWMAIFLAPFGFVSLHAAKAVNSALCVTLILALVVSRKGDRFSVLMILTSFPFIAMVANGGLDWVNAIGFLAGGGIGTFIVLAKPQSGSMAFVSWFISSDRKLRFFLVTAVLLAATFLVWGAWPLDMLRNVTAMRERAVGLNSWNSAPFPFLVPIGIWLLWLSAKNRDEFLGALATYCLVPYFAISSLVIAYALLCAKHRRLALVTWTVLWAWAFASYYL